MKIILAEKPSVARDIASLLGCREKKEGYINGDDYIVTWAFGHLVNISRPEDQNPEWKNIKMESLPFIPEKWKFEVSKDKKKQFNIIKKLFNDKNTSEIICATDAGREGEHIFRLIYQETGCKKPFKRLWISSLTNQAVREGFRSLHPGSEFDNLADAAMARAKADWLVGLNFSIAYSRYNQQKISTGRVQTPTLAILVQRESEIKNFVKSFFYEVHALSKAGFTARYLNSEDKYVLEKDFAEQIVKDLEGLPSGLVCHKEVKRNKKKAPPLYNLLNLQKDANKLLGLTAAETLEIAQSLYEKYKLITYPRTESNHISSDMVKNLPGLIKNLPAVFFKEIDLSEIKNVSVGKAYVDDTKLTDHHAIIPTGNNVRNLKKNEENIFRLICEQFISIFLPPCITEETRIDINIQDYIFRTQGTVTIDPGWKKALSVKKSEMKEKELPDLSENDKVEFEKIFVQEKETKPPARFNDASLLSCMKTAGKLVSDKDLAGAMKENGIGTPATRAGIIEKLIAIGYCERVKKNIVPTQKGIERINSEIDQLKSPALTGAWEQKLKKIEDGKYPADKFYEEIINFVSEFIPRVAESKKIEKANFGKCPLCGKGVIIEGKKGFGCSDWKDGCRFVIWKTIAKKTLTKNQVLQILNKGQTKLIKGFTSKAGKKFEAGLVLKEGKIEFNFQTSKKKKK